MKRLQYVLGMLPTIGKDTAHLGHEEGQSALKVHPCTAVAMLMKGLTF